MKLIRSLSLSLLVVLYGMPSPARADAPPEAFALPDGRAAEAYQTNIEAVLREKYRLKIDTGAGSSVIQWFHLDGELPPGLTVRTDGTVAGVVRGGGGQSYRFRVKVVDMAAAGSEPLVIDLALQVAGPRIKLTRINAPALVPVEPEAGTNGARVAADVRRATAQAEDTPRAEVAEPAPPGGYRESSVPVVSNLNPSAAEPAGASGTEPTPALLTRRRGRGPRNVVAKVAGTLGLAPRGAGGGSDESKRRHRRTAGCASDDRVIVSDEAHAPLKNDTSNQNVCVKFDNLNTLKYRVEFSEDRTTSAGPSIASLPFIPQTTTTTASATTPGAVPPAAALSPNAPLVARTMGATGEKNADKVAERLRNELTELNRRFNNVRTGLGNAEVRLRDKVETPINQRVAAIQQAHKSSIRLANNADFHLQSGTITALLGEVDRVKIEVDAAIGSEWPVGEITGLLGDLDNLTASLEDIRIKPDGTQVSQELWVEWLAANETRYNRVRDRIAELKTRVNTVNGGLAAFNESKSRLAGWQEIITHVKNQGAAAFRQEVFMSCHADENENQSTKLTISKTDRTVENPTAVTRDVLTVKCYSRVAVTGGVNFSSLNERQFDVVQSAGETAGTVVKKFGFTSQSSFRPNPLLLLNVRFTDRPVYNWHASFGAVVDRQGQLGTDFEPVGGVSFSIRRLIFITPFAVHIGRETRLAGGFKVGDTVPDTVTTPPLEKAWKLGYTAGVTFRIAPQ